MYRPGRRRLPAQALSHLLRAVATAIQRAAPSCTRRAGDTDEMSDVSPESLTKPMNSAGQNNQALPRFVDTIRSREDQR